MTTPAPEPNPDAVLSGQPGLAAIVLWASGQFSTLEIAQVLNFREDAVSRTLHMSRSLNEGRLTPARKRS
ncbi:hypothetical protein LB566_23360 [Mesorhizobium sp. CA13]|uniref:hypothetical protein n=1 Tax=Mesorhizobium sp. CA13 TaxID=2876643 RepID=UPI001CCD9FF2|nr:hypothetical protein [Mesorhizobium sp. CA13]MBZ9856734.1 hypothetical protein [Mesorhizobium sp. CA13]